MLNIVLGLILLVIGFVLYKDLFGLSKYDLKSCAGLLGTGLMLGGFIFLIYGIGDGELKELYKQDKDKPSQDWINNNVMCPTPENKIQKAYTNEDGRLCFQVEGHEGICDESYCPFGMEPDASGCVDVACDGECMRGVPLSSEDDRDIGRPNGLKVLLTDYSTPGYAQVTNDEQTFKNWINNMIKNFCGVRTNYGLNVDIFFMYIHPAMDGKDQYKWFSNPQWVVDNFINPCVKAGVEPGLAVYANDRDSGWGDCDNNDDEGCAWPHIGEYIKKVNKLSTNGQIKYLQFDGESCQCGAINKVRERLDKGYGGLPEDFMLFASQGPGVEFGDGNPNDIGLGEVYWNVGQSWPCSGNTSQFSYYTPVCTEYSSQRAFKDKPQTYIDYLIKSSKQTAGKDKHKGGGAASMGDLTKIYDQAQGLTVPLFSLEALYSKKDGVNVTDDPLACSALAYWGTESAPVTADKVCGTFDGFAYWTWPKFQQFLFRYASSKYGPSTNGLKYVGIYATSFIPQGWMKGGKFDNAAWPELGNGAWPGQGPSGYGTCDSKPGPTPPGPTPPGPDPSGNKCDYYFDYGTHCKDGASNLSPPPSQCYSDPQCSQKCDCSGSPGPGPTPPGPGPKPCQTDVDCPTDSYCMIDKNPKVCHGT